MLMPRTSGFQIKNTNTQNSSPNFSLPDPETPDIPMIPVSDDLQGPGKLLPSAFQPVRGAVTHARKISTEKRFYPSPLITTPTPASACSRKAGCCLPQSYHDLLGIRESLFWITPCLQSETTSFSPLASFPSILQCKALALQSPPDARTN